MKYSILFFLACIAFFASDCIGSKKKIQTAAVEEVTEPLENTRAPMGYHAAHVYNTEHPDSIQETVQNRQPPAMVYIDIDALPKPSASRKAYLASGWWNPNMAFQATDSLVHLNYLHRWLRFREDQTFDIIYGGKKVDTGRWTWDDSKEILYLSCHDPYFNNSWQVVDKGFVMIWKGNTTLNVTGIQIRVNNSPTPPAGAE